MTELVANISRSLGLETSRPLTLSQPAVLGLILIVLQIADGVLTGFGMSFFGTQMEGNVLLRTLMHEIGVIPALVLVKSLAIAVVIVLVQLSSQVSWLPMALKGVIGLYMLAAVIPWSVILATHIW
jgi:uncharacterized membrane protein